jgi:hypothetical protein
MFGGTCREGLPMTYGCDAEEGIYLRIDQGGGGDAVAISLDLRAFSGGTRHEDGAITLGLGGIELVVAKRDKEHWAGLPTHYLFTPIPVGYGPK